MPVPDEASPRSSALADPDFRLLVTLTLLTVSLCGLLYVAPHPTIAVASILALFALSLWRWELVIAFRVSGVVLIGFSLTHLGVAGLTVPLLFVIATLGLAAQMIFEPRVYTRSFLYRGVLLFGLLIALSLIYSADQAYGLRRLGEYTLVNLLIFSVVFIAPNQRALRRLLYAICGFGLAVAFVSLIDLWIFTDSAGIRYGLLYGNPIWYGRSIGLTMILLLALTPEGEHPLRQLVRWLLLLPLLFLLAEAGSRGPIVATGISFSLYLWWRLKSKRLSVRLSILALALLGAFLVSSLFSESAIVARVSRLESGGIDYSSLHRLTAYGLAIELFLKHPLLGIGAGGFSAFHFVRYPHNLFLEVACEYGLVGLTLLGALITATVRLTRRVSRMVKRVPAALPLYRSLVLILVFAFVNAQVSGSITGNNWLWIGAGGLLALAATLEHQLKNSDTETT